MPRRKKSSRRVKPKSSWADLAAHANTAVQLGEPFLPAATALSQGDVPGAIAAARPALQEAASMRNVGQVAIGYAGRGLAKKAIRAFGVKAPVVAGRRLF